MDVLDAIKARRSVRAYQNKPVEEELLQKLLDAARLAPSANNRQDWKFVVVKDATVREKMIEACCNQKFVGQAPVVIVACTTDDKRIMRSGYQCCAVDVTIAVDHMTLAAAALGLGTCWIGAFERDKVAKVLGLPSSVQPVHVLPLGYPAETPPARPRKKPDEVVCVDTYK